MAKNLTVRTIEAIKPSASRQEIPDGGAPGLHIIVQPSGSMSWAYRYRSPTDGKTKKFTIGRYPNFSLAQARDAAREAAMSVSKGGDPAAQKAESRTRARDRTDLTTLIIDDFIKRHCELKNKPKTLKENKRMLDVEVRPVLGHKKVGDVTKAQVKAMVQAIVDRGSPTSANRVLSITKKFFNWCVDEDIIETSPAIRIKDPSPEVVRKFVLNDNEIRWFWMATEGKNLFCRAYRLMLFTGQRREEVGTVPRTELHLDEDQPYWDLPAEKAKNEDGLLIPLAEASVLLLRAIPAVDGSDLVFTNNGRTSLAGWSRAKANLDKRMKAAAQKEAVEKGLDPENPANLPRPWRVHDLRRTAATNMAKLRVPPHVIEAALNHQSGEISGVAKIYNRYDYFDEKAVAMNLWQQRILHLAFGSPAPKPLPIRHK